MSVSDFGRCVTDENDPSIANLQRCMANMGHVLTREQIVALILAHSEMLKRLPDELFALIMAELPTSALGAVCRADKELDAKCKRGAMVDLIAKRKFEVEWRRVASEMLDEPPGAVALTGEEYFDATSITKDVKELISLAERAFTKNELLYRIRKDPFNYKALDHHTLAIMFIDRFLNTDNFDEREELMERDEHKEMWLLKLSELPDAEKREWMRKWKAGEVTGE